MEVGKCTVCDDIKPLPQLYGTCAMNALLMCLFYSQTMRAIMRSGVDAWRGDYKILKRFVCDEMNVEKPWSALTDAARHLKKDRRCLFKVTRNGDLALCVHESVEHILDELLGPNRYQVFLNVNEKIDQLVHDGEEPPDVLVLMYDKHTEFTLPDGGLRVGGGAQYVVDALYITSFRGALVAAGSVLHRSRKMRFSKDDRRR